MQLEQTLHLWSKRLIKTRLNLRVLIIIIDEFTRFTVVLFNKKVMILTFKNVHFQSFVKFGSDSRVKGKFSKKKIKYGHISLYSHRLIWHTVEEVYLCTHYTTSQTFFSSDFIARNNVIAYNVTVYNVIYVIYFDILNVGQYYDFT